MKTLAIIGSTGSIGNSTIKVFLKNKKKFNLVLLAANSNYKSLIKQTKICNPKNILLFDKLLQKKIKNKKLLSEEVFFKRNKKKIDYVISGVSGYASIDINFKLLNISKNLLIANKETIVCGGKTFLKLAKKKKCNIVPIDSEHHCIDFFLKSFALKKKIKKYFITASGGPFLEKKIKYNEKIKNVLNHPTWKMGKKITVDSSTFANKILELFEAQILFDIPKNDLQILIEKKSNIHSIIKLNNNIYIPLIHKANMELTISNCLNVKNNFDLRIENLNFILSKPDLVKFPLVTLGYKILNDYGSKGMILFTVLNERLVKMFLEGKIKYGEISFNLVKAFKKKEIIKISKQNTNNLNDIKKTILYANTIKL